MSIATVIGMIGGFVVVLCLVGFVRGLCFPINREQPLDRWYTPE